MFFTIKLYLHLNCVPILNWIVWNRTIFIKMDLALNNLQRSICHKKPNNQLKKKASLFYSPSYIQVVLKRIYKRVPRVKNMHQLFYELVVYRRVQKREKKVYLMMIKSKIYCSIVKTVDNVSTAQRSKPKEGSKWVSGYFTRYPMDMHIL